MKDAADALKPSPKEPHEKVLAAIDKVIEAIRKERVNLKEDHVDQIEAAMEVVQEELDKEPEVADPMIPAEGGEETPEDTEGANAVADMLGEEAPTAE